MDMAGITAAVTGHQAALSASLVMPSLSSTPGDTIVVGIALPSGTAPVSGVADTSGTTYTMRPRSVSPYSEPPDVRG